MTTLATKTLAGGTNVLIVKDEKGGITILAIGKFDKVSKKEAQGIADVFTASLEPNASSTSSPESSETDRPGASDPGAPCTPLEKLRTNLRKIEPRTWIMAALTILAVLSAVLR